VNKILALISLIAVCTVLTAACAKSSENTSGNASSAGASSEASAAAQASSAGGAMSNAAHPMASGMAMSQGGAMVAANLPIPLSKLPSATVAAGDTANGDKVFSANCESCHGVKGKNGTVGPSLAGIGIKAGQVAYMVQNPAAIDKESSMPKLPLSAKEIADVSAYVASLK